MLRYFVDELLIKLSDYFKFNKNNNNNTIGAQSSNSIDLNHTVDANNNNVATNQLTNNKRPNNIRANKVIQPRLNLPHSTQFEELDWFKEFRERDLKIQLEKQKKRESRTRYFSKTKNIFGSPATTSFITSNQDVFDNYLFYKFDLNEEEEEDDDEDNEQNFLSSFKNERRNSKLIKNYLFNSFKSSIDDELNSFFSLDNNNKDNKLENKTIRKTNLFELKKTVNLTNHQRSRMTSINGSQKNSESNDSNFDFLYSYLDNETDAELVELLRDNLVKSHKVFQKSYYQEPIKGEIVNVPSWRMKEKMKTVSAALVMCLNIGVDPPDVVRTSACSKLECWINQTLQQPQKTLEAIGIELQKQYERWQPRARYKHCLDPTSEDVKKLCISLRKNAKDERVLFHYNGHGVPRPTQNGEIWVFNKEFTQYIPLSLYEVQTWMGTPSIYVWDCSNAGLIVQSFLQFEEDRENEFLQRNQQQQTSNVANTANNSLNADLSNSSTLVGSASPLQQPPILIMPKIRDSIHLAACGRNELLPCHPTLPLDLFTACLTTPIKAALHWYAAQKNSFQLIPGLTIDMLERIPGQVNDRRTMLGELNWIFTAITDTIAWNVLDSDLFQKLFRQDLLVASLFRNFLLAERIMKSLNCTPVSHPRLPSTNEHPLWQSWDLALDMCISQLPFVVGNPNGSNSALRLQRDFVSCGFFTEQIEIFDVWLRYNVNSYSPPEQLPIVLQVLLSQQHRLKALELLGKFLDFGPWAVSAALSVGIFPYVLKLLSTQPRELRPLLTFIWAKILAVDKSCQAELVKDKEGLVYFIQALNDSEVEPTHKVYSAFVLSCLVDQYPSGQESAKQNHLIATCSYSFTLKQSVDYKNPLLRQWCCICLGLCWQNFPEARWEGVRNNVHARLIELISDPVPEVRAAAIFALGTYIGCGQGTEGTVEQTNKLDAEIVSALIKDYDIVFMVRQELIVALFNYINQFLVFQQLQQSSNLNTPSQLTPSEPLSRLSLTEHNTIVRSPTTPSNQGINTSLNSPSSHMPKSSSTSAINKSLLTPNGNNTSQVIINSPPPLNSITESTPSLTNQQSNTSLNNPVSPSSNRQSLNLGVYSTINGSGNNQLNANRLSNSTINTSILANSNKLVNNLFLKVWCLLVEMQNDPYPQVAELAQKVVNYFLGHLGSFDLIKQTNILRYMQQQPHTHQQLNACANKHKSFNNEQKLQISTEFVPWCCKYFLKPLLSTQPLLPASMPTTPLQPQNAQTTQMSFPQSRYIDEVIGSSPSDANVDIYAVEFLDQHCKLLYNHKVKKRMPSKWTEPQNMDEGLQIKHATYPIHCKLNPYDDQLFIADRDCMISVYETQSKLSSDSRLKMAHSIFPDNNFIYNNSKKPVITSFKLINVQHDPIFLTGTDDRIVRLFKPDLSYYSKMSLITAFKAFGDNQKRESTTGREAGLITEWNESNESLLCAGDTDFIRVWDMNKELYKDYPTRCQPASCVSSLSSQENWTVAGFGEGSIKLYDFRQPVHAMSKQIYQHDAFVLKVKIHKPTSKLITSSSFGDVSIFDIRKLQQTLKSTSNDTASVVEVHPINQLFAVGYFNQSVKVFNFNGKELTCIKHHEGFLGKRIANLTCLDWNHHKNEIVFGSQDNFLTMFSCKET